MVVVEEVGSSDAVVVVVTDTSCRNSGRHSSCCGSGSGSSSLQLSILVVQLSTIYSPNHYGSCTGSNIGIIVRTSLPYY